MISREKRAVLHIAKKQIGLDDDEYRSLLDSITGGRAQSSAARNFYDGDFLAAIRVMEQFGYNAKLKMTKKQFSSILKLNKGLGWSGMPQRLEGYSERVLGFKEWRKADTKQAAMLIQGLIKLLRFENEKKNKRQGTQVPADR